MFCVLASIAHVADAKYKLELGAGAFGLTVPEYVGAEENKHYLVPLPYAYFKSERLKIDRQGLLGNLWEDNNWHLDISASGGIPVESDDVKVRQGMPDIDWRFQAGPALKYFHLGNDDAEENLYTELFVRKAFLSDFTYIHDAGWQYGVSFNSRSKLNFVSSADIYWQNKLTINFATAKYQGQYYNVANEFVNADRAYFKASTGYFSSSISSGLTYKKGNLWLASFLMLQSTEGGANTESALMTSKYNIAAGIGAAWIFKTFIGK